MSDRLKGFLVDLVTDPARMSAFRRNPSAAMKAASLTASERRAVTSRDHRQIRETIGCGPSDHLTQFTKTKAKKKAKKASKASKAGSKSIKMGKK